MRFFAHDCEQRFVTPHDATDYWAEVAQSGFLLRTSTEEPMTDYWSTGPVSDLIDCRGTDHLRARLPKRSHAKVRREK